MITDVYYFKSETQVHIMALDATGQQIAYTGPISAIIQQILRDAPLDANFHLGKLRRGYRKISRTEFEKGVES